MKQKWSQNIRDAFFWVFSKLLLSFILYIFIKNFKKIAFKNIICADIKKKFLILLKTHSHTYVAGLYMIGYGIGKNIYKFPPFGQLNQEYLERQNSKKCCIPSN